MSATGNIYPGLEKLWILEENLKPLFYQTRIILNYIPSICPYVYRLVQFSPFVKELSLYNALRPLKKSRTNQNSELCNPVPRETSFQGSLEKMKQKDCKIQRNSVLLWWCPLRISEGSHIKFHQHDYLPKHELNRQQQQTW